ncbi:MAG: FG-GAP repeat protein, partial [Wenzhouxiangella sp.]
MIHSRERTAIRYRTAAVLLSLFILPALASTETTTTPAGTELPDGVSQSDWQSIRAAYERNRHAVRADADQPGTLRARNPGQQWTSEFDGHAFRIDPDHGQWQWGLELKRWGFAGQERPAAGVEQVDAEGQRTVYDYADGLEEWFVNDARGLEHGFTVHRPPAGSGERLRFELDVTGELAPAVADNARNVAFVDGQGNTALTYNGLKVWDADGRMLAASFEAQGDQLALTVEADSARYPITIDPVIQQQAYLKASNTGEGDEFGFSVAASGDTVVVGAPREDSDASGVDGDQGDDTFDAGAAYVFVRDGSDWTQQAYLKASNTDRIDWFGWSVAVSGDTVVVGAMGEDSDATGVDGDKTDDSAEDSGAAYVFVRDGSDWSQQAYLKASNTEADDEFGRSVAVSGDTVVVGAPFEDSDGGDAGGVTVDQNNNDAPDAGAAYVFVRDGSDWSQQAYLKASNTG